MLKKRGIFNILLLVMTIILSLGVLSLHNQKEIYLEKIDTLKFQLDIVENEYIKNVEELKKIDLLRYI